MLSHLQVWLPKGYFTTGDIGPFLSVSGDRNTIVSISDRRHGPFTKSTGDIKLFLKSTGDMNVFLKLTSDIRGPPQGPYKCCIKFRLCVLQNSSSGDPCTQISDAFYNSCNEPICIHFGDTAGQTKQLYIILILVMSVGQFVCQSVNTCTSISTQ
jgi:hypothetical protein